MALIEEEKKYAVTRDVICALIDASFDKHEYVCYSISNSLYSLGIRKPNLVIEASLSLLRHDTNAKLNPPYKCRVMNCIEHICRENIGEIDYELIIPLIRHCISDISAKESSVSIECQMISCNILVEIGTKYLNDVMDALFVVFQPGTVPSHYVMRALADLTSKNVYGMVPYLKLTIGTMIPVLTQIRSENMKWVFAYSLMKFSESIQEYLANMERAPDPNVTKDYFVTEFSSSFDVLFTWVQVRDPQLRGTIIEALGSISVFLSHTKLEEIIPKLIPFLLSSYKRQSLPISSASSVEVEHHSITKGLCIILEVAIKEDFDALLETQIENIISHLFVQICAFPDYSQPSSIRNHNEILRCFATLTLKHSDYIVPFVLQKLESNSESIKIGSLTVLKHLINSCDSKLSTKMPIVLFGLKLVLNDDSIRVRKMLAQVIVAIAYHGYLDLDGGQSLIQFIIRQCSLSSNHLKKYSPSSEFEENSVESLKTMCENVIYLLVTAVKDIENVLWPHLFEYLLPIEYIDSAPFVCKLLGLLLSKLSKDDNNHENNFTIDFNRNSSIPKPPELMARLCILIGGTPILAKITPVLNLLKLLHPLIDQKTASDVIISVQKLIDIIESNQCDSDVNKWQIHALKFVIEYAETMNNHSNKFAEMFGRALLSQMHLYNTAPENKYFLLLVLGHVISKFGNKQYTSECIDMVFANCDHSIELERKGAAHVSGQCSTVFLDMVLVKLEQFAEQKKGTGILSMLMDTVRSSASREHEKMKASVVLSYGYVTQNAPPSLLMTRLETPLIRSLTSYYKSSKDTEVKLSFIKSVQLIADAVTLENLKEPYILRSRNELLNEVISILKVSPQSCVSQIRLSLDALTSLVKLNPILSDKEKLTLIDIAANASLTIENNDDVIMGFKLLMKQILVRECSNNDHLELLIRSLRKWLNSQNNSNERENAIKVINYLLQSYIDTITAVSYVKFSSFGSLLGFFIPRCTDPHIPIRSAAFTSLKLVCCINDKLQSRSLEYDEFIKSIDKLSNECASDDPQKLFSITSELSKCISMRFQSNDANALQFLKSLIEGLSDPHSLSSNGTCTVLSTFIKLKGAEMKHDIQYLIDALRSKLMLITCHETRRGTFYALRYLAHYHLSAVIKVLLKHHIPFDDVIVEMIQSLAQDESINQLLLELLFEMLAQNTFTETVTDMVTRVSNKQKPNTVIANIESFAVICALKHVFSTIELNGKDFSRTFITLILAIASYINAEYIPNDECQINESNEMRRDSKSSIRSIRKPSNAVNIVPVKCAIETFRSFLVCSNQSNILSELSASNWTEMENDYTLSDAISQIARSLSVGPSAKHIPSIINVLTKTVNSPNANHRIVSVAFYSEFLINRSIHDDALNELILNTLLNLLVDPSPMVRKLCVRGLGQIKDVTPKTMSKFSTTVISAMLTGMDDKEDVETDTVLEAIKGLSCILSVVCAKDVSNVLVTIAMRLRAQFDKDKPSIRKAAFSAFAKLTRFANESNDNISEQIQGSLIPIFLQLNDDDDDVSKICKTTLKEISFLLNCPNVNDLIQKHLSEDSHVHYGEFTNTFCKAMIKDMPNRVSYHCNILLSYLKSERSVIQSAACTMIGAIFGNITDEIREELESIKERVINSLIFLLKAHSSDVRVKAAEALSLI